MKHSLSKWLAANESIAIDEEVVVKRYLQVLTPVDVATINRWTSHADVPLDKLIALAKKLKPIEPVAQLTVYRGIGTGLSYQEKMDLYTKKFFMHFLKPGVKPGFVTQYATPRPLSFTDDIKTARAFGNTVVSTVFGPDTNYIRITHPLWEAINRIDAASLFQEVILLDINKPISYTVVET